MFSVKHVCRFMIKSGILIKHTTLCLKWQSFCHNTKQFQVLHTSENIINIYSVYLMDNLFDNEPTFFKLIVRVRIYYTIDDFRWGEYKDWSIHGCLGEYHVPWVDQSLYSPKLKVINCFIILHILYVSFTLKIRFDHDIFPCLPCWNAIVTSRDVTRGDYNVLSKIVTRDVSQSEKKTLSEVI